MKNFLLGIILAVSMIGAAIAQGIQAQKPEPEQVWTAYSYCTNEESARTLSNAMAREGVIGYDKVLKAQDNNCYHSSIHRITTPRVILVEPVWRVTTPENEVWEFWTAKDSRGDLGWVWFIVEINVPA